MENLIELLKLASKYPIERQRLIEEFQNTVWDYDVPVGNEEVFEVFVSLAHDIEFIEDDPDDIQLLEEISQALIKIEILRSHN